MARSKGPRTEDASRLAEYEAKRSFDITPEPRGSSQAAGQAGKKTALEFVVQKHDARRMHYDVRLEIEGAMASWAVPKGPSYDPTVRRLAVRTEDHPMEYNRFEGRIPDGEYGAGDVLIWDRGTYETVPPGQERPMLEKGHLHVRLFGDKLVGEWHLISPHAKGARGEEDRSSQWLFFKAKDGHANPAYDVVAQRPESLVSGRQATRGPRRVGASEQGVSARALHDAVGGPMLATVGTVITDPGAWLFEVKYDGYRLHACKAGGDARLYTRRGHDWTDRFGPIAEGLARVPARECVLDGEACAVDEEGRPSFQALQAWLGGETRDARIGFAVFDLLWLDGRDLRTEPIEVRRELLSKLLDGQGAPMCFSRDVQGDLEQLLEAARGAGLEGLMAKRKGSPYVDGRSSYWVKLRLSRRQDCAVIGWIPLAGTTNDMGALVLGVLVDGALVHAGRVGTGFTDRDRRAWATRLAPDAIDAPAAAGVPKTKGAHWVTPRLVVECDFTEWTGEGSMRHPKFVALREDKTPAECEKDGDARPAAPAAGDPPAAPSPPPAPGKRPGKGGARSPATGSPQVPAMAASPPSPTPTPTTAGGVGRPKLSNPAKVLFPRDGITKQQIWDYYTAIAPVMLPHLAGRPLTMQRYPDGIDGEEWYQQNIDKTPPYVRIIDTGPRHEGKKRIACDSVETLQYLANLAALTIHQWCSHVPPSATTRAAIDHALAMPDYVVLDLDPGDGPWSHLVEVAMAVRALLEALELVSFVKTSGKRGLHVVVPIAQGPTHAQATGFAERVARAVAKVLPEVSTVERMKDKRGGKLYVDYGQNGEGRTIVSPYTIRARDGAVVSTPITWDEVTEDLDPTRFTIRTVLARVEKVGDLYAGALRGAQKLP